MYAAALKLVPLYEPSYEPEDLAELSRPVLRYVELEVEYEIIDEDFALLGQETVRITLLEVDLEVEYPGLSDPWFAGGEDVERARTTISLDYDGALDNDMYLPEPRSFRIPIAVGVGIAAAAAAVLVVAL